MSCLTVLGAPKAGYGLLDALPRSRVKATTERVLRLRLMSEDSSPTVRAAAASNPMLPTEILEQLSQDASVLVRSWAARNPNASLELLQKMRQLETDESLAAYLEWLISAKA